MTDDLDLVSIYVAASLVQVAIRKRVDPLALLAASEALIGDEAAMLRVRSTANAMVVAGQCHLAETTATEAHAGSGPSSPANSGPSSAT